MLFVLLIIVLGIAGIAALASCLNLVEWMPWNVSNPSVIGDRLVVDGLVQHPLNLTMEELMAMPRTTVSATLYCVDGPDYPLASGNWTGVQLAIILEQAHVSPSAMKVAFHANDGFSTDLTVEAAMRENVILAYERDGQPLTEKLRLVVPGHWGYKWISNLGHIELVDHDFLGSWESRGYPDDAEISPRQ